jgi:hypothetical protein
MIPATPSALSATEKPSALATSVFPRRPLCSSTLFFPQKLMNSSNKANQVSQTIDRRSVRFRKFSRVKNQRRCGSMQAAALGRLSVFLGKAVVVHHLKSSSHSSNPNNKGPKAGNSPALTPDAEKNLTLRAGGPSAGERWNTEFRLPFSGQGNPSKPSLALSSTGPG